MDAVENADDNVARHQRRKTVDGRSDAKNKASSSKSRKIVKRKRSRRFVNDELPSPPPNPLENVSAREALVSAMNTRSDDRTTVLGVDDAFDHLDKLHSMLDEILDMRDRNAKLFRRVRELERVRATRKAHTEVERSICMGQDPLLPDEDVGFAESLLGAMLASSYEVSTRSNVARNSTSVNNNRINRSRSVVVEPRRVSYPVALDSRHSNVRRSGQRLPEIAKKRPSLAVGTPKVSKWTRVKAAFKWERAACTANDAILEPEATARYLRIPDNVGGSSEVSGPPTPAGTISSSSSIDDVFHRSNRPSSHQSTRITRRDESSDPSRRSRSLDGEASVPMTFVYNPRTRSKDNSCAHGKSADSRSHKTPWGKVKGMMQLRRDSIGKQTTRNASRNDDAHSTSSIESSDIHRSEFHQIDGRPPRVRITGDSNPLLATSTPKLGTTSHVANDFVDLASRRLTPTLTITVPSSEELRSISSPESITPPPPARRSFESGKSDRYSQPGYETPKETRTDQVSPASSTSGILRYGLGRSKTCQGVPFAGDYKRQQSLKGESLSSSPKMYRRDSKWDKVKRAFLTSATSVPTSPSRISSYFFDDGDATGGSYSASASAEDLDNDGPSNPGAQAEIQRNYRLLHDKLGTEFYRKLAEWERLKTGNARDSSKSSARDRDNENLRLLGEDRLTPEFKKKLEEWKRMNKTGSEARGSHSSETRSVNRRRITDWQLWRSPSKPDNKPDSPRLSDDFLKKMEEWKRIKSSGARREPEVEEDTRTRNSRGAERTEDDDEEGRRAMEAGIELSEERRRAWKSLEDEEFRSLERVLEAMEMDRQTRLSKLQRIVGSLPQRTQEVLIHTSTGLYRFEGISRKFTRKLYEWEKSQGISPELSTFRLLDPLRYGVGSLRSRGTPADPTGDGARRRALYRSKSVGSVHTNSWRTTREHEKPAVRRPSSFSMNDIDKLKTRSCMLASSVPTFPEEEDTSEDIAMEDSEPEPEQEPEAVIVDIEDVIEETASPLTKYQPHQTPVYSVAGSETTSIAIPLGTVTARHEPSPVILIEAGEAYPLRNRSCSTDQIVQTFDYSVGSNLPTESRATLSSLSTEHQDRRSVVGSRRTKREAPDEYDDHLSRMDNVPRRGETLVASEAKSHEIEGSAFIGGAGVEGNTDPRDSDRDWRVAQLSHDCRPENVGSRMNEDCETYEDAVVTVSSNVRHSKKILKTRRLTDSQVGYEWRSSNQPLGDVSNVTSLTEDSSETRASTMTEDFQDNPNVERIIINEETMNKIVVPTASSSATISAALELARDDPAHEMSSRKEKRQPRSVFVKTKRIVFSSFRRESKKSDEEIIAGTSNVVAPEEKCSTIAGVDENSAKTSEISSIGSREADEESRVSIASSAESSTSIVDAIGFSRDAIDPRPAETKRPPLPQSPVLTRKDYRKSSPRETSPGIRTMIRRYNEKLENKPDRNVISGFSAIGQASSANSSESGSSSPSWRTPVIERRLMTQLERYDEAKKPVVSRGICYESCHASCERIAALAKSQSADFFRQSSNLETRTDGTGRTAELYSFSPTKMNSSYRRSDDGESTATNDNDGSSLSIRAMKIRRAKEDFLSKAHPSIEPTSESIGITECRISSNISEQNDMKTKKKLTIDVENCAARVDLVKSASAGMINVDADTFERLQMAAAAAAATRVSDSLPRSNEHLRHPAATKETASRFTQIARKFKRARLRRAKEKETGAMSTVSMLCRQSLLVDIAAGSAAANRQAGSSGNSSRRPESCRRPETAHPEGDHLRDEDPKA